MNLVACNIYITAGRLPQHSSVLVNLLQQVQTLCLDDANVVVVHAFSDPTYNRTSFHLAANSAQSLVSVTSKLAIQALQRFSQHSRTLDVKTTTKATTTGTEFFHPHVGVVDHISIMPLSDPIDSTNSEGSLSFLSDLTQSAHQIGQAILVESDPIQVHYYGMAHPQKHSLSQVRREKTSFFRLNTNVDKNTSSGMCLIGVPSHFVENYNVRVQCSSQSLVSRTLTKRLRERDGGIVGVEALTLPYGDGCWEVAMNLLRPNLIPQIEKIVNEWKEGTVVEAYQVGSTVEQCRKSLQHNHRQSHDETVMKHFLQCFKH